MLAGVLLLYQHIRYSHKEENWPSVEGVVVSSVVNKQLNNLTYHYKPFIKYTYVVGNEQYDGTYYQAISNGYLDEESALKIIKPYPEGTKVIVHYNPNNPDESVLADLQ